VLFFMVVVVVVRNTKPGLPALEEMVGVVQEPPKMVWLQSELQTLAVAVVVQTDMESRVAALLPER
jgi:hypothetical protein